MTSLEKIVIELRRKKREATKLKQNAETQLKQLQSAEKRSATGLQKMIKQIESEKEDVSDVSENLTRKNAQVESIQRLVSVAEDRVNSEKEIVDQTEQEIEFAETPEEKQNAEARLRSLNDHVQELISEIKSRQKMEETANEARRKQGPAAQYPTQPTPPPDPKAEDWAENNEWFGKDNAMTYTAFDLHRKLTEEEGYDPKSNSYYEEIDKRIKLEFPHKFGKVEQQISKPTQNVASATRSSKTSRTSVRLTPSQVAIAKKLRVPLEEYARQLKLTEGE